MTSTPRAPQSARWVAVVVLVVVLAAAAAGCTLSRPEYVSPPVAIGTPDFARAIEAHTLSTAVDGNRLALLLNGDEIFPAMLSAIRSARHTVTFANFVYEDGDVAVRMAEALAERCRAGVTVHVLLDAVTTGRSRSTASST